MFIKNASFNGFRKESFAKKIWFLISYPHPNVRYVKSITAPKLESVENKYPKSYSGKILRS